MRLFDVIAASRRRGGGASSFVPTDIAGLDLWLDASDESTLYDATSGGSLAADDGPVFRWEDKSSSANHVIPVSGYTAPYRRAAEINGMDIIDFNGTSDVLFGNPISPTQIEAKTVFMVIKTRSGTGVSNGGYIMNLYEAAGTGQAGAITAEIAYRTNGNTWVSSTPANSLSGNIITLAQSGSGTLQSVISMWLDGNSVSRTSGFGSVAESATPPDITVGGSVFGSDFFFDGQFGELLIYESNLSATDRESVESYLSSKWAISI